MDTQVINIATDGCTCEISVCHRSASQDLVFLVHGLGCSKNSFSDVWDDQNFKDYSLLSIDLPGFGHSSKPKAFSYSMEDHAKVCEAVLRHFPKERLHFVGHSMGAAIGLLLSDELLDSVLSFVNVEGNLIGEDCGYISRSAVTVPYDVFKMELFPGLPSQLEKEKKRHFSLDTTSPSAFYRSSKSLVAWSESGKLLERFKDLKCKKVYFYGDQNAGMKILAHIDGVEKIQISRSGHFPMNDNPDEFYSKLHEFLSHVKNDGLVKSPSTGRGRVSPGLG